MVLSILWLLRGSGSTLVIVLIVVILVLVALVATLIVGTFLSIGLLLFAIVEVTNSWLAIVCASVKLDHY